MLYPKLSGSSDDMTANGSELDSTYKMSSVTVLHLLQGRGVAKKDGVYWPISSQYEFDCFPIVTT